MKKIFTSVVLLLIGIAGIAQNNKYAIPNDGKQYCSDLSVTAKTYDRGIKGPKVIFSPKGTLAAGVKVAYSNQRDQTVQIFGDTPLNGNTRTFSVIPQIFYTFKHNHAIGLQFDYDHTKYVAKNSAVPGVSTETANGSYFTNTYTGRLAYRYYNPIANSRRFALILGGFIGVGGGDGQLEKRYDIFQYSDFYTIKNFKCSLFFSPGVAIAISDLAMLDICIEALGVSYEKTTQLYDGKVTGVEDIFGARWRPDLFSVRLGVTFQIPVM
ncbi:MAG: hypothetical protein HUJ90_01300 [Bacteroidales bacterium]|nr:hypothetical protein [Bacteroidales bacterium]